MEMEPPVYSYKWGLVEKLGTTPKQILEISKHIFWDINLKFGTQLCRIFGFDSLAVLEWIFFCKIYIFLNINI